MPAFTHSDTDFVNGDVSTIKAPLYFRVLASLADGCAVPC